MEPRIQYAKASDGVSIAYSTTGDGVSIVHTPWHPFSHLQMEWNDPDWRAWYGCLSRNAAVLRYDGRGSGLSSRAVGDYSLDSLVSDLDAVVDRAKLDQFALLGVHHAAFAAIAYAAQHAARISHLVLWCACARGSDWWSPDAAAFLQLLENWDRFTETLAHDRLGWSHSDAAHRYAAIMRSSSSPEAFRAAIDHLRQYDVLDLLPQLSCPVLVMQPREVHFPSVDLAKELVSRIPDARLVLLEGTSQAIYLEDREAKARTIHGFLGIALEEAAIPDPSPSHGAMAVIVFADIVDSTALSEQLGDATFRERSRVLEERVRAQIMAHGGTPVAGRTLGDGVLATFASASDAIRAAGGCATAGEDVGLALHLGLHAGDIIREDANVYGQAVSIASRVSGLSGPNEILVSGTVRDLARASAGVSFEDRGERELKGVSEPVRLFAVRPNE